MNYYFGFDIFGWILWIQVSPDRFGHKIASLMLRPSQLDTITPGELKEFFQSPNFILRDGWRLFRALPKGE